MTLTAGQVIGAFASGAGVALLLVSIVYLNVARKLALFLGYGLILVSIGIAILGDVSSSMEVAVGMGLMGLLFFGIGIKQDLSERQTSGKSRP